MREQRAKHCAAALMLFIAAGTLMALGGALCIALAVNQSQLLSLCGFGLFVSGAVALRMSIWRAEADADRQADESRLVRDRRAE